MIIKNIKDFDLKETLDCGQSFRWEENADSSFSGTVYGRKITVSIAGDDLYITGESDEEIWNDYFDLNLDYGKIKDTLSKKHPVLKQAAKYAPGIRVLKQEPFETLCSFIISQNNNIPRIKGIIKRLCEGFGKEVSDGVFDFPAPGALSSLTPEDLAPIRSGFRASYLIDAAKKVCSGEVDLDAVSKADIDIARSELMKIKGVGAKVAECTLLYGMHRLECFPLDVWMKRAMEVLFPGFSPQDFGQYAGIAQQYIFHYSRMHPQLFKGEV